MDVYRTRKGTPNSYKGALRMEEKDSRPYLRKAQSGKVNTDQGSVQFL